MILHWIRIEAKDQALGASCQEICQWTVRIWSLGNPSRQKEWEKTKAKKKKKKGTMGQHLKKKVTKNVLV